MESSQDAQKSVEQITSGPAQCQNGRMAAFMIHARYAGGRLLAGLERLLQEVDSSQGARDDTNRTSVGYTA